MPGVETNPATGEPMGTATTEKPKRVKKAYHLPPGLADDVERRAIDEGRLTCRVVEDALAEYLRRRRDADSA